MKEPSITNAWIEAAKILGVDSTARVLCPKCNRDYLAVVDVDVSGSQKFERILRCPLCGSRNIMSMTRKPVGVANQ